MEFSTRAAELTTLLESRITNFYTNFQVDEIGRVVSVGDGIARVYGLNEIQAGGIFLAGVTILLMARASIIPQKRGMATGPASDLPGDDGDDEHRRRQKDPISSGCKNAQIKAIRELIVEIFVEDPNKLVDEVRNSNRVNWAIKTAFDECLGGLKNQYADIKKVCIVLESLGLRKTNSPYYKHVMELLREVKKSQK